MHEIPNSTESIISTAAPDPLPEQNLKAVFTVQELAERWCLHPESIRRMMRDKKIKPLRGFRPFRIPFDEIRRYEQYDYAKERQKEILARKRY